MAGPAATDQCLSRTEHVDALAQIGRIWLVWLVPVTRTYPGA